MHSHNAIECIYDMHLHASDICAFTEGKERADLDTDRMLMLAITRALEIIGEAANKISPEERVLFSEIPWIEIVGLRNRLAHEYASIDLSIVWNIATSDIPILLDILETIINRSETEM